MLSQRNAPSCEGLFMVCLYMGTPPCVSEAMRGGMRSNEALNLCSFLMAAAPAQAWI